MSRRSPVAKLPDLWLDGAGLDTNLGVDANGLLQVRHRGVAVALGMQQVGQVVVERRLAVAVTLGGTERKGCFGERAGLVRVPTRCMYEREVVQRSNAGTWIVQVLGIGKAALQVVQRLLLPALVTGEHTEDTVGLGQRAVILPNTGELQSAAGQLLRTIELVTATGDQAAVRIRTGKLTRWA